MAIFHYCAIGMVKCWPIMLFPERIWTRLLISSFFLISKVDDLLCLCMIKQVHFRHLFLAKETVFFYNKEIILSSSSNFSPRCSHFILLVCWMACSLDAKKQNKIICIHLNCLNWTLTHYEPWHPLMHVLSLWLSESDSFILFCLVFLHSFRYSQYDKCTTGGTIVDRWRTVSSTTWNRKLPISLAEILSAPHTHWKQKQLVPS